MIGGGGGVAARWGFLLAATAGFAAQALIQPPLAKGNAVRASRRLSAPPSSFPFRMVAGGVKEAAGDALWLTVLPSMGKPWAVPAMTDANPRAHYPLIYGAYFLEMIEKRNPAIERVILHGMEIEKRGAFGTRSRPNREAWDLPETLGMNLFLYGADAEEKERGISYLRNAAAMPTCPTIIIDVVSRLREKEGSPLEGWDIWLLRAASVADPESRRALRSVVGLAPRAGGEETGKPNPEWTTSYLAEADRTRLEVLRKWCAAAELKLGRWPRTWEEAFTEAPGPVAADLRARPVRKAFLLDSVRLLPDTRDIEIPSLTQRRLDEGKRYLLQVVRSYEAANGRNPRSMGELASVGGRDIPPPPRNGTRWDLDPSTGEPVVVPDQADPPPPSRPPGAPGALGS